VESSHGLRMAAKIGSRHPAHSTALGKSILAYLPEATLASVMKRHLEAQTEHTITDPQALRTELERVRRQGTAEEIGENEQGARCVGVAIFDQRGLPVAAISVSGPDSRIDDERAADIAAALRESSRTITASIGGTLPADSIRTLPEET
jgi:IclR family transcriptional regulator, acetate operon repressor